MAENTPIPGALTDGQAVLEVADRAAGAVTDLADQAARYEYLLKENEGLAEEVLRTYEQLNLVFDITAQVAVLSNTYEVKRLLCERLRTSLNAQGVWCVGWYSPTEEFVHPDPVACGDCSLPVDVETQANELAAAVRAGQRVLVRPVASRCTHGTGGQTHIMAGPLRERESAQPLVMCAIRCCSDFTSGDMLLFDSVLEYGGYVLRNLHLVERLKRTSFETVRALVSAIDKKDPYTSGHSERVGILARMTGQEMGLPPEELQELEWAGLLHDIGKIGIPETILNKPGRLTEEEYAIVKQHPQMSYEVLRPVVSLAGVMRTVIEHHENHDGTGYPAGLRGEEISLAGRIMHVVDVFDALTSSRSYRQAYDLQRALAIIQEDAGTKLDPKVVEKFNVVLKRIEELRPAELDELFSLSGKEVQ